MALLSNKIKPAAQPARRPPSAVELTPEGVLAAALPSGGQSPVYAFVPLPGGALAPGIVEANIRVPDAVATALQTALDQVSPRSHSVTLIVPDVSVRVFVLDFDSLPAKPAEALPVLRFRLRKMVPFDVEHAGVSYQVLAQEKSGVKVLTSIIPGTILAEYESAVRAAGYEPGAVLPSSLAALAALDSVEPLLVANLSSQALTTSISSGQDLLLYRTIDLPADPAARLAEVQRAVAVAAAFYEDKLTAPPRQLHYAGAVDLREFTRALAGEQFGIVDLAPPPPTGLTTTLGPIGFAGVYGALAGVA